jgi:integrase/recombinase XerD
MKLSKAVEGYSLDSLSNGYSKSTITSYQSSLNLLAQYLGDPEIETITGDDLKRFFLYLRTDYQPRRINSTDIRPLAGASLHGKWKAMRSLWNWASELLGPLPAAKTIPMPKYENKPIVPFTEEETKKLIRACEITAEANTERRTRYVQRRPTAARDKAIVLILIDTGIRVGELSRLCIDDVDLESGEILIRPFGRGLKTRGRVVNIANHAKRALWLYLAKRSDTDPSDPLFLNDELKKLDANAIKTFCRRLGERCGITGVHPHRFRHTFAIQYLRNGGDPYTLQKLLGHKSMEMVRRYLDIAQSDISNAHKRASPADRWRL